MRKWALPGLHSILFFIRDPFVLAAYFIAFKYQMWPRLTPTFSVGLGLGALFVALALIQAVMGSGSPIVLAYGLRNYFFYMPFAFLIGAHFKGRELKSLCRYSLIAAMPIAILCYQQFRAGGDDPLNASYSASAKAMLVTQGVVRTTGTFTVASAQTLFIGSIFAILVICWLLNKRYKPLKGPLLWLSSAAVLTTLAVSGARSVFIYVICATVGGVASTFILKPGKIAWKKVIIVPALVVSFAIGYVTFFPRAVAVMIERQMQAEVTENATVMRMLGSFTAVTNVWPKISLIGAGIGVGTNGGAALSTGTISFLLAEDEWSRIVLEVGISGFLYIGYRIWLAFWLLKGAIKSTRRSFNPAALLLASFTFSILLVGQMTLQGTINGYGWLFTGFCIAANNLKARKNQLNQLTDIWV